MIYADFHTHSVYSDGTKTVKEIIDLCVQKDIKFLSLTDHDTTDGLLEASQLCKENNIQFVNGTELTAEFNGEEIHILAYNFDINNPALKTFLDNTIKIRDKRNLDMIKKLQELDIDIKIENLSSVDDSVITRGDIAAELIRLGVVNDNNEAFDKYLKKGGVAFVKKQAFSYKEVLKLISNMGAISSLAHPNLYNFYKTSFKSGLAELKRNGLNAIECYHSSFNSQTTNTLIGYCNRNNLLQTCGSDYHGDKKKNIFLGQATDGNFVSQNDVSEFIEQCFTK